MVTHTLHAQHTPQSLNHEAFQFVCAGALHTPNNLTGKGVQGCAGCGFKPTEGQGGTWRTCPRNANAKNTHEDGGGVPGQPNGRGGGGSKPKDPNHPGKVFAPFL